MMLDTNFVISLDRETTRKTRGPAHEFLGKHPSIRFCISFTVAAELACGGSMARKEAWRVLCRRFPMIGWNREISWRYGEIYRHLQARGQMIGANDLWIAATALVHDMPVVTNNVDEFRRVPGLQVFPF